MKRVTLLLLAGCSGQEATERWRYERVTWEERPQVTSREKADALRQEIASRKRLTLHEAYALALHRSETLAIEGEELTRLRAQFDRAVAAVLPTVAFKAGYLRQEEVVSELSSFTLPERREYKFTLRQPLFSGLRDFHALRQAGALADAKEHDLRRARLLVFVDLARAFYTVLLARQDFATTEHTLKLARERLAELVERNRVGMARRSEVLAQEAETSSIEARFETVRGALETAWETFQFVTGLLTRPELADSLSDELPPLPALLERALVQRTDLKSLEVQIAAAEHAVRIAQGGYLPALTLDANYYLHRDGTSEDIDWDATISLDLPLFDGLATFAKIREAESSLRAARFRRDRLLREVDLEVRRSYVDVRSLEASKRSLDKAVASAEENYEIVQAEYRQGIVTNLEALQSIDTLQRTRLDRARTETELRLALVRLWVSVGETPR